MSWGSWFSAPESTTVGGISGFLPECETPHTLKDFKTIGRRLIRKIIRYERESNPSFNTTVTLSNDFLDENEEVDLEEASEENSNPWVPIGSGMLYEEGSYDEEGAIRTLEKPDEALGISCLKTVGYMPCPPKVLLDILWSEDIKDRQRWDHDIQEMSIVERVSSAMLVAYRSYRPPFSMITPRDFVALNGRLITEDGLIISFGTSINHSSVKANPKFVRANVMMTGFVIEPIQGKLNACKCTRFVQLDPKGMIPTWVVNATKSRAAQSFFTLRTMVKQRMAELAETENSISPAVSDTDVINNNNNNNNYHINSRQQHDIASDSSSSFQSEREALFNNNNNTYRRNNKGNNSLTTITTTAGDHSSYSSTTDSNSSQQYNNNNVFSMSSSNDRSVSPPIQPDNPLLSSPSNDHSISSSVYGIAESDDLPKIKSDVLKRSSKIEFPLPKVSSEEFHRQQILQKQQQQQKEQELLDKLQKRQQLLQQQQLEQQQQSFQSSREVEQLLHSLTDSIRNIQFDIQQNTDQVRQLELLLAKDRAEREKLLSSLQQQTTSNNNNTTVASTNNNNPQEISKKDNSPFGLGWQFIGFALVWPFVTYAVSDLIIARKRK